jgi:hypothetical protein
MKQLENFKMEQINLKMKQFENLKIKKFENGTIYEAI